MTRRSSRIDAVKFLALAAALVAPVACGRSEKAVTPKAPPSAPAANAAAATAAAAGPTGGLARETKEGEAKVADVVKESTGAPPREVERGKRIYGPTPTPAAGLKQRPRY